MKKFLILALSAALGLAGCASGNFGSSIRTVGVNPNPTRGIIVLAPAKANVFSSIAQERNGWLTAQLQAAINRQLAESGRFSVAKGGTGDGTIVFNSLRHGLLEVSANNYAAQVVAEVTLMTAGGKSIGTREVTSTAGDIHPLTDFEDSKLYEEALQSAVDKLALELVANL